MEESYVRLCQGGAAELTVRLDTLYRGIYCGLCRAIGQCTGQCSRLTLSYDMVFLYLVRASLLEIKPRFVYGRCALHPFRRRLFLQPDDALRYAAKASALLFCGKLRDDRKDERGARRLFARLLCAPAERMARRAGLPALQAEIESRLTELSKLEAEYLPSVDAPADLFGQLLGAVFSHELPKKEAAVAVKSDFVPDAGFTRWTRRTIWNRMHAAAATIRFCCCTAARSTKSGAPSSK